MVQTISDTKISGLPVLAAAPESRDEFSLTELVRSLKRRKRLIILVAAVVTAAFAVRTFHQLATSPVYKGSFDLLISDPIKGGSEGTGAGGVFESLARNRTDSDVGTLTKVMVSPLVLDPIAKKFNLDSKSLAGYIFISAAKSSGGGGFGASDSGILTISATGNEPEQVERLLNALSTTYLQYSLSQRQERLREGLRFLDQQEPALQKRVKTLQNQLADFRIRHNLITPDAEAGAYKAESTTLGAQLRVLQNERENILRIRDGVQNGTLNADNFTTAAEGLSVIQADSDKIIQLKTIETQLSTARATYSSDSPQVTSLVTLRDQLAKQLLTYQLASIDNALSLNQSRKNAIQNQIGTVDAEFTKQPSLIKQYQELEQRVTIAIENLVNLLKTRDNFQLEMAQNTVPWKVISPPTVSAKPVEPNVPGSLLQGLMMGLVAGVGAGLLRDRSDHVFHLSSEVEEELKQPLLGHIPHVSIFSGVREEKRFFLEELDQLNSTESSGGNAAARRELGYQRFFYQEALRNLYTSIRFLNTDHPLRSVALTSSLPSEGKSLVNVLLAKTLSEMGQRILLIDADMRKPQLHYRLGLNNLTGLSNLLTDESLDWQDLIHPVKGRDNWWVLTSGRVPPDPTRLLSSDRMSQLINDLAESNQFDLILYDTPPILGLADAALIAQNIDGLILLVSLGMVDRDLPKRSLERILSSGASFLGIVTNSKDRRSDSGFAQQYKSYGSKRSNINKYNEYGYMATYSHYNPDSTEDDARSQKEDIHPVKRQLLKSWEAIQDAQARFMNWLDR